MQVLSTLTSRLCSTTKSVASPGALATSLVCSFNKLDFPWWAWDCLYISVNWPISCFTALADSATCFRASTSLALVNCITCLTSPRCICEPCRSHRVLLAPAYNRAATSNCCACAAFAFASSASSATTGLLAAVARFFPRPLGVVPVVAYVCSPYTSLSRIFFASAASPKVHCLLQASAPRSFKNSSRFLRRT